MLKKRTNFISLSTRILRFYSQNKGLGHTRLCFEGLNSDKNSLLMGCAKRDVAFKHNPDILYVNHFSITQGALDRLHGHPAIMDHQMVCNMLADALTLINSLFEYERQKRKVWSKRKISHNYVPYFEHLVFRVNNEVVEDVVDFNMEIGWYSTPQGNYHCDASSMKVGLA